MGWLSGLFVYFLIWWVVLFAVLPWRVEVPDRPREGHASSAPIHPYLWQKALATTGISLAIWLVVFFVARSDLVSFRVP